MVKKKTDLEMIQLAENMLNFGASCQCDPNDEGFICQYCVIKDAYLIAKERRNQILIKGTDREHNQKYADQTLLIAAICLITDLARAQEELRLIEQALSDPENQPSQFGTVTLSMYSSQAAEIDRLKEELKKWQPGAS